MRRDLGPMLALVLFGAILMLASWSWSTGGLIRMMWAGDGTMGDNEMALEMLRQALAAWGPLAPAAYVAAVVVEVVVAPIPGTVLYAPGGAIFGGFWGGLLSLAGNTIGALVACGVGATIGERAMQARLSGVRTSRYVGAIRNRGIWVILLLRLNPLTSSDLVSYAAGSIGIPAWRVGIATLLGMAPLCFAQAYLAQEIFAILPGAVYVLALLAAIYVVVLGAWLWRTGENRVPSRTADRSRSTAG